MKNLYIYLFFIFGILNLQIFPESIFNIAGFESRAQSQVPDYSLPGNLKNAEANNELIKAANIWDTKPVVVWSYQHQLISKDGRSGGMDIEKSVNALKDLGATGIFLPIGTEQQYNTLMWFLEQTKNTDLKVYVQTGARCNAVFPPEYAGDCVKWAKHLATKSLTYPNLVCLTADDLRPRNNTDITPEHLSNVISEKNKINPNFMYLPTLYYDVWDEIQYFRPGNPYKSALSDGSFMWYWASYGSENRAVNLSLYENYLNEAHSIFPPAHFLTGIYTQKDGRLADTFDVEQLFHSPNELRTMIEQGYALSDGLALFNMPLMVYDIDDLLLATMFQQQENDDQNFDYKLTNSQSGTWTSWYQAIETDVSAPAGSTIRVKFDMRDNLASGDKNYMFKQLLINGKIIWEEDVTLSSATATIDKSVTVLKENAKITIRLFSKRASFIRTVAYVEHPYVSVDGEQVWPTWKFDSGMTKLAEYREVYDIIKSVVKKETSANVELLDTGSALNLINRNGDLYCNNFSGSVQIFLYNTNGQLIYRNLIKNPDKNIPLVETKKYVNNSSIILYKIVDGAGKYGSGKISFRL